MAVMDTSITDRRHIPDRRATSLHSQPYASRMTALDWIAMAFLIIGGINWGLIGILDVNVVAALFGAQSLVSWTIYVAVGISALYSVYLSRKIAGSPT